MIYGLFLTTVYDQIDIELTSRTSSYQALILIGSDMTDTREEQKHFLRKLGKLKRLCLGILESMNRTKNVNTSAVNYAAVSAYFLLTWTVSLILLRLYDEEQFHLGYYVIFGDIAVMTIFLVYLAYVCDENDNKVSICKEDSMIIEITNRTTPDTTNTNNYWALGLIMEFPNPLTTEFRLSRPRYPFLPLMAPTSALKILFGKINSCNQWT